MHGFVAEAAAEVTMQGRTVGRAAISSGSCSITGMGKRRGLVIEAVSKVIDRVMAGDDFRFYVFGFRLRIIGYRRSAISAGRDKDRFEGMSDNEVEATMMQLMAS